jgi:hypothetical protein
VLNAPDAGAEFAFGLSVLLDGLDARVSDASVSDARR